MYKIVIAKTVQMINLTNIMKIFLIVAIFLIVGCSDEGPPRSRLVLTEELRDTLSPHDIIKLMEQGNQDFASGNWMDWDFQYEQIITASGQCQAPKNRSTL